MELGKCGNGKVLKALGICILAYFHIFTFAHCAEGATFDMLSCCPGEDNATQARFVWHSDSDDSSYPSRTPVSWTLSAFDDDDDTQYILDRVTGYDPPRTSKTLAYPLDGEPPPAFFNAKIEEK